MAPALHSRDTSLDALRVQMEVFRRMSPGARLEQGMRLSEEARDLLADGVRARRPDLSDPQVRLAVIRLWLGPDLFERAFGKGDGT